MDRQYAITTNDRAYPQGFAEWDMASSWIISSRASSCRSLPILNLSLNHVWILNQPRTALSGNEVYGETGSHHSQVTPKLISVFSGGTYILSICRAGIYLSQNSYSDGSWRPPNYKTSDTGSDTLCWLWYWESPWKPPSTTTRTCTNIIVTSEGFGTSIHLRFDWHHTLLNR